MLENLYFVFNVHFTLGNQFISEAPSVAINEENEVKTKNGWGDTIVP